MSEALSARVIAFMLLPPLLRFHKRNNGGRGWVRGVSARRKLHFRRAERPLT